MVPHPYLVAMPRPAEGIVPLAARLRPGAASVGATILSAGSPPERVYFVRTGSVELRRRHGQRRTVVGTLGAGGVFGDLAAVLGRTQPVEAVAVTDVGLWSVSADDLLDLLDNHSELASWWLRSLASRLLESHERLDEVTAGPLDTRVALALVRRARGRDRVDVTQQQLADLLGVQRSSVNQAVRRLEVRGLVRRGYGHLLIRDRAGLGRLVEG